jgi:hypothetical protein
LKKYLAIVLSLVLVLSIAALSYAADEPQIKLNGKIVIRGWSYSNVTGLNASPYTVVPNKKDSATFYTTNGYIMLDAKVADNVQGYMELETGTSPQSGIYWWGNGNQAAGSTGQDSKANANLWFRQLWLQYSGAGIGIPTVLKAGHMPISLGEKQFLNNERFGDDVIMLLLMPSKELTAGLVTLKVNEVDITNNSDDLDAYTGLATYKFDKDSTAGANLSLVKNDMSDMKLWNLGLHANGKAAGLSYAAELDWQMGNMGTGAAEMKFKGYGVMAKVGYMINPVNIRASAAMGSGDDDATDKNIKQFFTIVGQNTTSPIARSTHFTQIYERTVITAAGTGSTGISNTTYFNLGADVTPMADLSLSLDAFMLRATKAAAGVKKDLGNEIDFKANYKLAKNLNYFFDAGYFMTGDFYKSVGGKDENVTQIMHGLSLTF